MKIRLRLKNLGLFLVFWYNKLGDNMNNEILEGEVTGVTKFGAFVQLKSGESGLVHISEIGSTYVKNIDDFVKVKDRVKVKVLSIDENGKINLSIKQALDVKEKGNKNNNEKNKVQAPKRNSPPEVIDFSRSSSDLSFEEQMNKLSKDYDDVIYLPIHSSLSSSHDSILNLSKNIIL